MARFLVVVMAVVLALALAACAGPVETSQPGTGESADPSASDGSGQPQASESAAPWLLDPAAGLALVRFPNPDLPVSHVFVVAAGGTIAQVTGISRQSAGTSDPAWSPNRTQLAFGPPKTGAGMTFEIGVVNADGTEERVLGQGQIPRWSPDGGRILFSEVDDVTSEPLSMYVVDVATAEVTELGTGFNPRWLPDGRISFNRMVGGATVVFVMALGGGEPEEFAQAADVLWAPDGSAVLIAQEGRLWLANPDGSDPRELVEGYDPVWSLDSSRIVYAYDVNQDAIPLLAVVDLEGNEIWSDVPGASPTWSPDSSRLAVEVGAPEAVVRVLDAASGEVIWEADGLAPAW